jgi:hypothetical protein
MVAKLKAILEHRFWTITGVPIGVTQRILGHQNRRTTKIYRHTIGDAGREAMNKLEAAPIFQPDTNPDSKVPTNLDLALCNR